MTQKTTKTNRSTEKTAEGHRGPQRQFPKNRDKHGLKTCSNHTFALLCTTIFCFFLTIRSFSNNPLAENAETRRRREIQVIWLFLREQLAVGFLTWLFSPCRRVSVREWLFGYLAVPPRLRALCVSARRLLAISLVPASQDCTTIFCFLLTIGSFSNNPLPENAETRRRREIQVIWLFLREQLAVGFLTWLFSPCRRVSVREWLLGYLALWLFLRASALSASPREGCWLFFGSGFAGL